MGPMWAIIIWGPGGFCKSCCQRSNMGSGIWDLSSVGQHRLNLGSHYGTTKHASSSSSSRVCHHTSVKRPGHSYRAMSAS